MIAQRRCGEVYQILQDLAQGDRAQLQCDDLVTCLILADPGGLRAKVVVAEQDAEGIGGELDADVACGVQANAVDLEAARQSTRGAGLLIGTGNVGSGACRNRQGRAKWRELPARQD